MSFLASQVGLANATSFAHDFVLSSALRHGPFRSLRINFSVERGANYIFNSSANFPTATLTIDLVIKNTIWGDEFIFEDITLLLFYSHWKSVSDSNDKPYY